MKPFVLFLCLALAAAPVLADETPKPPEEAPKGDVGKGFDLMQEGTRLMLRGLVAQMEPEMRRMAASLMALMGDISAYAPPEMLPNGDIIIRRKVPLTPIPPGDKGNETDL